MGEAPGAAMQQSQHVCHWCKDRNDTNNNKNMLIGN